MSELLNSIYDMCTNPVAIAILVLFVISLIWETMRRQGGHNAIDRAIYRILGLMQRKQLDGTWSSFSAELKATLQDSRRVYLRERGLYGVKYLEYFVNTHIQSLSQRFIVQSRHKVPHTNPEIEMLMIHLRSPGKSGGLTVWITREGGPLSQWYLYELYIHSKKKEELGYSLTGKSLSTRVDGHIA